MALPASGQITLDQIHVEAGGSTGTECGINDTDIRTLAGISSGEIGFDDFRGKSTGITLKSYGMVINTNTNSTSYSGSLSASVAVGDMIVLAKTTGYGDYNYGSTTVQGSSPTTITSNRVWSSPTYGHFQFLRFTATSAASSISVSCSEGSTNRQAMYVYAWLIGGGAQYEDNARRGASTGTLTVDTGEDGAIIVGSAYSWSAYAMPNLNNTDYETTFDRNYHVWVGHAVQSGTAATYSMTVATQGSNNHIASFTKA